MIHNGKSPDPGEEEFFDLAQDPFEQKNLVQQFPIIVNELKEELLRQSSLDHIDME